MSFSYPIRKVTKEPPRRCLGLRGAERIFVPSAPADPLHEQSSCRRTLSRRPERVAEHAVRVEISTGKFCVCGRERERTGYASHIHRPRLPPQWERCASRLASRSACSAVACTAPPRKHVSGADGIRFSFAQIGRAERSWILLGLFLSIKKSTSSSPRKNKKPRRFSPTGKFFIHSVLQISPPRLQ